MKKSDLTTLGTGFLGYCTPQSRTSTLVSSKTHHAPWFWRPVFLSFGWYFNGSIRS